MNAGAMAIGSPFKENQAVSKSELLFKMSTLK